MARYIDADKVLLELQKFSLDTSNSYGVGYSDCLTAVEDVLNEAPTADVAEVKHGEWIRNECNIEKMKEFHEKGIALSMSEKSIFYTCSCCGSWGTLTQKHCSECGAKMDGGKEE